MSSSGGVATLLALLIVVSSFLFFNSINNPLIQAAVDLQIQFVSPTPADEATVTVSTVTIATTSTTSAAEHSVFLDWDSSLVAWWRFNDAADLTDHSTYSNDGTDQGSTFTSSGKMGGAREFDETRQGSYIQVSDHTSLDTTTAMTVAAWVNLDTSRTYHAVITKDQPDISYWFGTNDEKPVLYVSAVGGSSFETCLADTAISTGAWHHIAFTYEGSSVQFYTDGSPNGGCSFSGPIYLSTSDVWIGDSDRWGQDNDNALDGKIDELMVFNRALTDEEILSLYDADTNSYNSQISGLSSGTYTYQAHTIDSDGDTVQTEQRTVTIEVAGPVCGDNNAEPPEVCDGTDLGDSTCATIGQGFTGGTLACLSDCSGFNTSGCITTVGGLWDIGPYEYVSGVVDTEPPTLPQNLVATTVSHEQIDLSWDPSTDNVGVTGYKIYRNDTYLTAVTVTSYSDTGLSLSTTYAYQVLAYDAAGQESELSDTISATTLEAPGGEICNNNEDDDSDGFIGCADPECLNQMGPDGWVCECTDGASQACGTDEGICTLGTMPCIAGNWSGECNDGISPCGGTWDNLVSPCIEDCTNDLDYDCNGVVNDGCLPGGDGATLWMIIGIVSIILMIIVVSLQVIKRK